MKSFIFKFEGKETLIDAPTIFDAMVHFHALYEETTPQIFDLSIHLLIKDVSRK